jgi:hypothetical protein
MIKQMPIMVYATLMWWSMMEYFVVMMLLTDVVTMSQQVTLRNHGNLYLLYSTIDPNVLKYLGNEDRSIMLQLLAIVMVTYDEVNHVVIAMTHHST